MGQGDIRPRRQRLGVAVSRQSRWFYNLNSYTAAELVGGSIGILAVAFQWNRADTESFSRMVGSMGVAAVLSANPLLLVITVVAFARAFQRARLDGEFGDLVDGSVRGTVVATFTIFTVAQVAIAGGPVGLSFLVGLVVGILANTGVSHVSVAEIGGCLAERAKAAAAEHDPRNRVIHFRRNRLLSGDGRVGRRIAFTATPGKSARTVR